MDIAKDKSLLLIARKAGLSEEEADVCLKVNFVTCIPTKN